MGLSPGQERHKTERLLDVLYHDGELSAAQLVNMIPMFTLAEHRSPTKTEQVNIILELCTKLNFVDVQEIIIKTINQGE